VIDRKRGLLEKPCGIMDQLEKEASAWFVSRK
jgi:hypothetical protein